MDTPEELRKEGLRSAPEIREPRPRFEIHAVDVPISQ